MRRTLAKGAGKFCPRRLSEWRKCTRQLSLAGSSWHNHQTLPTWRAIFTVGFAGRFSLCSHIDIMKCWGVSKAVINLPVINACVWKHLGGACWISTEIHQMRMSWSVRGKKLEGVLLWYVIVSIPLQRTWSPKKLVSLILSCQFWQRCLAWWMHWRWEAAMNWSRSCRRILC